MILRALLGTVWRPVLMVGAGALVAFTVPKILNWNDARQAKLRADKIASAAAHEASANVARDSSALLAAAAPAIRQPYDAYVASQEVQGNPIARGVATRAAPVIRNLDDQLRTKTKEATELRAEVKDLKETPPPPEPRLIPYINFLGTFKSKGPKKFTPTIRAGVDYRIVKWVNVKIEGGYEPPPAVTPEVAALLKQLDQDATQPEWRLTAGGHIRFR